ncbi:MAG: MFS transporter [Burkholderiaceae bacterium]|nr:MFS transporter [Burkholderiaceae bacterium]
MTVTPAASPYSNPIAYLVVLAGVCAALHVWKLPPALPILQQELGLSLVQSGFLLSLVQAAGMLFGVVAGLLAIQMGLRRCLLTGLLLISAASAIGAYVHTESAMLLVRAAEGCGFLMVSIPAPGLIKRLVAPAHLSRVLSVWSCYLPAGTAIILLGGSWVLAVTSWRVLWLLLALLTTLMAVVIWRALPSDSDQVAGPVRAPEASLSWMQLARLTLSSHKVWLVGVSFGLYTFQWATVIGFLPSIYDAAGISGTQAGLFTAIAAGANLIGNLVAGRALQKGWQAQSLLYLAFAVMAACALFAFGLGLTAIGQLVAVVIFSAVGGLIPAVLFILAVRFSPSQQTTPTTIGLVQQCNAIGQFVGPPVVAVVATLVGGWHWTWVVTASCAILGMLLAWRIGMACATREQME